VIELAHTPTPVDDAPRLSAELGIRVCVKRDDLTGLALGGNKARKLQNLCADAIAHDCDVLVTGGGAQSNHVRQTAAAGARLGLNVHLVLGGAIDEHAPTGNVLLDLLFGASIECVEPDTFDVIEAAITAAASRLTARGRRPYAIPIGGASPPGVRAFADAARELRAQRPDVDVVFVADGSGGTHAGLLTGFGASAAPVEVVGVDVGARPDLGNAIMSMSEGAQAPTIDDAHIGPGYAIADTRTIDALKLAATTEGLVLDPVYTGKAMAALVTWARAGKLANATHVCFWHTGGQPALFAERYRNQLGASAT
jgi:D-cysteine desulfhydrase family pyridoxal phosphate-dependent enzyme